MPLPKPKKENGEIVESESEFMERCISSPSIQNEFNTNEQRVAVCQSLWNSATKSVEKQDKERFVEIEKTDKKNQVVKGIVYTAGYVDTDGETMTVEDVQKAAWNFLAHRKEKNIDINHNWEASGCYVIETYMTEEGDPNFPPNSWVIAVKCTDDVWEQIENGDLNGFSFGGTVNKYPARVLLEVAKQIIGETYPNINKDILPEHTHNFVIYYDEKGNIVKGITDVVEEHFHTISYGTATDKELGHSHRVDLNED